MKQLSSMMTGSGLQRLQHAADADAAGEMQFLPICAQEPTVAQVSTMVPLST